MLLRLKITIIIVLCHLWSLYLYAIRLPVHWYYMSHYYDSCSWCDDVNISDKVYVVQTFRLLDMFIYQL